MRDRRPIPGILDGVAWQTDVPHALPNSVQYSPIGEVAGGAFLLHAAGIGRFHIYGGRCIAFSVAAGANPWAVDRFLWGDALAGLIHQRGELPLHAAAVLSPDRHQVIAFCGPSGAGKSTMTAAFLKRGWWFFSDDLTRITAGDDHVLAWPGPGRMKLRTDACYGLGIDTSDLVRDGESKEKFIIHTEPATQPVPLAAIITLAGREVRPRLELLSGGHALAALASNVSGPRKLRALGRLADHFILLQRLLTKCPIFRLHGRDTSSAEALSRVISETIS